eukprot:gene17603-20966_t
MLYWPLHPELRLSLALGGLLTLTGALLLMQLDHLSNEDLARILTDDQAFLDLVSHIQLTTLARTNSLEATEELRAQNVQLASECPPLCALWMREPPEQQ